MSEKDSEKKIEEFLKTNSKQFTTQKLETLVHNEQAFQNKVNSRGIVIELIDKVKTLFSLVKDYQSGVYTHVPWSTIAVSGVALLYFISPLDFIPDFIPIVGYLDDSIMFSFVLNLISIDLDEYKEWKANQGI